MNSDWTLSSAAQKPFSPSRYLSETIIN